MKNYITIIGGGLAGTEAAYQIAKKGIKVKLYEMKPMKFSPAHSNQNLAEIVCSNSFKSNLLTNACGLLKEELRRLDSLLIKIADETSVPAGQALAVDRKVFSEKVTKIIEENENIEIIHEEITNIEEIAKEIGVEKEEIAFSFDAIQDPISLQEPVYNDGAESIYIMDQVKDSKNTDELWAEKITIKGAMEKLNEKERMIINKRFFDGRTQMEVAEEIGISQAQVSRLEKTAIQHIKRLYK